MRLGLIIYGSLTTISGGYLYDRQLVDHLTARGDTVQVISLPWRDYARHLADNLSSGLLHRLRQSRFDLLLQDELNHPSLVWLNRRLRGRVDYPLVAIVHHPRCAEARPAWQNRVYRWVERHYLTSVDAFVVNSQTTRAAVEALAGPGRPLVVAYPAGDRLRPAITPAQLAARGHEPGPLRLLFIGNLIARKGLHTLVAALSQLKWADWQLTVVGSLTVEPAYVAAVRRQIERAGLGDRVQLLGALADAALAEQLARSHVLAVPSSYEGYGIVYVEAMGFGLPVIASTAGAAREIVTDGREGWLVAPDDAAGLAARLRTLIDDRDRLLAMSLAAQQRYAAHPTWAMTTSRIGDFLRGLTPVASRQSPVTSEQGSGSRDP
jgi:glycosyltransferase involved in cell wall biosynthesis